MKGRFQDASTTGDILILIHMGYSADFFKKWKLHTLPLPFYYVLLPSNDETGNTSNDHEVISSLEWYSDFTITR